MKNTMSASLFKINSLLVDYENTQKMDHKVRIIVLDDDPIFGKIIHKIAKNYGVDLTFCQTVTHFSQVVSEEDFDAAIIDYYLDNYSGPDIADVLEGLPIVLISNSNQWAGEQASWPRTIKKFVNKSFGMEAIMEAAIELSYKSETKDVA